VEAVGRVIGIALVVGLVLHGCGDGGNDNGISFRAVGIFQGEVQNNQCQVPTAEEAIADQSIEVALDDPFLDSGYPTGIFLCRAYIWLESNLQKQGMTVDRLDFEYEIPGARIGIPAHSSSIGARLNPVDADPDISPSPFGPPNVYIGQPDGQLVPASLILFLRQNRQVLPQLPYTMIIHITAQGRTDAGERLTSNEIRYTIQFTQNP
jgi:hypothetical protein